jgi:hypothetical protein
MQESFRNFRGNSSNSATIFLVPTSVFSQELQTMIPPVCVSSTMRWYLLGLSPSSYSFAPYAGHLQVCYWQRKFLNHQSSSVSNNYMSYAWLGIVHIFCGKRCMVFCKRKWQYRTDQNILSSTTLGYMFHIRHS